MTLFRAIILFSMTMTISLLAQEQVWNLPPITGDQPNGWEEGVNWTWSVGNPYEDKGGQWFLATQEGPNPTPTSSYEAMQKGTYVGFYRIWQKGAKTEKDPRHSYRKNTLKVRPLTHDAGISGSSVLMFQVSETGTYILDIKASVKTQNFTAGYGHVRIYALSPDRSAADLLAEYDVNAKNSKAFGGYPSEITFSESTALLAGQELAVQLTAVNPGNASVGTVSLTFEQFSVRKP